MSDLRCYRSDCHGTLQRVHTSNRDVAYECGACSGTLKESSLDKLAASNGAIAKLASHVLEQ